MNIKVGESEINDLINECAEADDTGISKFPGMSYEQGIRAAIEWITGETKDHPLED